MMFVICNPLISAQAQIGLALRILCGFGIGEIADAFLTNKETINKRLLRAKARLREARVKIEFPNSSEIHKRLDAVLRTLYLLFNEGYYSSGNDLPLRKDLCLEAMRLCHSLTENEQTNAPAVNALLALMCFHSSRFDARVDDKGEIILYQDQDTSLWNKELIERGEHLLSYASQGDELSKYHLEAGIAYWHTVCEDSKEKWEHVLQLYNQLVVIEYSPVVALNRTYALSKVKGKEQGILEAEKLKSDNNHFYHALLSELYLGVDKKKTMIHLERAPYSC